MMASTLADSSDPDDRYWVAPNQNGPPATLRMLSGTHLVCLTRVVYEITNFLMFAYALIHFGYQRIEQESFSLAEQMLAIHLTRTES
jgi:hypothetical protein